MPGENEGTARLSRFKVSGRHIAVAASVGECLLHAAATLLRAGHGAACLLNSDSPTLPAGYLVAAATALAAPGDRVVLGPSTDGGYYLIGMKHPHPGLFEDIAWSTDQVFAQTLARAEALGLTVFELPTWYDVDDAQTLHLLETELAGLLEVGESAIQRLFALQKAAFAREPYPSLETRKSRLDALIRVVEKKMDPARLRELAEQGRGRLLHPKSALAAMGHPWEEGKHGPDTKTVNEDIEPLLRVENMQVYFPVRRGLLARVVDHVKAVDGLSLKLRAGAFEPRNDWGGLLWSPSATPPEHCCVSSTYKDDQAGAEASTGFSRRATGVHQAFSNQ